MSIPTYDQLIEPLLRTLAECPDGLHKRAVEEAVADQLDLSPADRAILLPSGGQALFSNRLGWAHDRLKRASLSSSARRGFWKITEDGLSFVQAHVSPLTDDEIKSIANTGLRKPTGETPGDLLSEAASTDELVRIASPEEQVEDAVRQLRESVSAQILESIRANTPQFFEGLVLDLLHAMGYGASRADLQRVGRSGDGGIDGIISLDRLGLERVYVQAKRWNGSTRVSRPEIQAFYGALAGQRANKGVFIATAEFTREAWDFARQVERIVLVDASRLTELMMDHEVGVSARVVKLPKIDTDYFESF